jgi:hypothetical protein
VAVITRSWSQTVALRPEDAIAAVADWLARCGATITARDAATVSAKAGSRVAMRLKGGWASDLREMPCVMTVQAAAWGPSHCVVTMEVRDDFGFGSRFGARQKFEQAMDQWITTAFAPLQPYLV